jgi:hypothetical protein
MTDDIIIPIVQHHSEDVPVFCKIEIALVQFVNWIDSEARGVHSCKKPSMELMACAGFDELYEDYWISYQKKEIEMLKKENDNTGGIEDTHTTKLRKR